MIQKAQNENSRWGLWHALAFIGVVMLGVGVIVAGFRGEIWPIWIWLGLLGLLAALTAVISHAYTHKWSGILIDDSNHYSLSRLQMLLWTMLILSAFVAAVLANIQLKLMVYVSGVIDPPVIVYTDPGTLVVDVLYYVGVVEETDDDGFLSVIDGVDLSQLNLAQPIRDGHVIYVPGIDESTPTHLIAQNNQRETDNPSTPLSVQIPSEVWLLLGISTTSLVAVPLISGQKGEKVHKRGSIAEARLSDIIVGNEIGMGDKLDLGKVQLLYVTLIVIGVYMVAVANLFLNTQFAIASLPALDGGVIAMLGVSHAGYLTNKAVPHNTGTEPTTITTEPPAAPPDSHESLG
jgi:hypothetical protein